MFNFCLCSSLSFSAVEVESGAEENKTLELKPLDEEVWMGSGGCFVLHHLPVKGLDSCLLHSVRHFLSCWLFFMWTIKDYKIWWMYTFQLIMSTMLWTKKAAFYKCVEELRVYSKFSLGCHPNKRKMYNKFNNKKKSDWLMVLQKKKKQ